MPTASSAKGGRGFTFQALGGDLSPQTPQQSFTPEPKANERLPRASGRVNAYSRVARERSTRRHREA
jgi:hypothetical protein